MQLIKIQSIPMEYQIKIQRPRLEVEPAENPVMRTEREPFTINMQSRNIQVRLDTTDMRRSIGLFSAPALIADQAEKGMQAALEATAELSRFGTQVGQIQDGVTISQLISQKLAEQPETITTFLPSVGPSISWTPNEMQISVNPGRTETDWELDKNVLSYIPGKYQMIIDQYPSVKIEYLGRPSYVPPSASPDYEEVSA